jgi:Zn-dependent protease with chaperone function
MRFFDSQKAARRNTLILIVFFTLGSVILSWFNSIALQFVLFSDRKSLAWLATPHDPLTYLFNPAVHKIFIVSMFCFMAVTWIFILKIPKPSEIANSLGGQLLKNPQSPEELKIANIVEEMSIASGVLLPKIYILKNSNGINAFAAGTDPKNMVIGVTQGAIDKLTRDELQGVIAHEFSHILNEDMKLNLTISGVVMTFFMAKRFGLKILRSRSRSTSGRGAGQLVLIGLVFVIFGSIGYFFGQILQSLISKQREFLADASSAQFTRHPRSLASALGKIELGVGSELDSPPLIEFAHIFFANGFDLSWENFFATHPPLRQRIRSLLPNENTDSFLIEIGNRLYVEAKESLTPTSSPPPSAISKIEVVSSNLRRALDTIGNPDNSSFAISQSLIANTEEVRGYLRDVEIARFTFALITIRTQPDHKAYLQELRRHLKNDEIFDKFQKIIFSEDERYRSLLFYYTLDTLRDIADLEKAQLINHMKDIFLRDQKISLYEGLLLINTEIIFKTQTFKNQSLPLPKNDFLQQVIKLKKEKESIDVNVLYGFASAFGKENLTKKKVLVDQLEREFLTKENNLPEEFRLLCMSINVPVPSL